MVNKMSEFRDLLNEQLKDPEFKKEWDDIQPEMDVIRAMIDNRIAQNLTQKELAERTGINQADISKLENGTRKHLICTESNYNNKSPEGYISENLGISSFRGFFVPKLLKILYLS